MKCLLGFWIARNQEKMRKIDIFLHFLSVSSHNCTRMINFLNLRYDLHPDLAKSSYGWSPLLLDLPLDGHHLG
jgi:hypothetical protein